MRLVFMGTPQVVVPVLDEIYRNAKKFGHELIAVVTQPAQHVGRTRTTLQDPPIAVFAKAKNIKTFQPTSAREISFQEELKRLNPDVVITAAYGQILDANFLKIPSRTVINIHPSLLPLYRGATPVQSVLLDGENKTGVSILFTVKALDAGAIIAQE